MYSRAKIFDNLEKHEPPGRLECLEGALIIIFQDTNYRTLRNIFDMAGVTFNSVGWSRLAHLLRFEGLRRARSFWCRRRPTRERSSRRELPSRWRPFYHGAAAAGRVGGETRPTAASLSKLFGPKLQESLLA